jgi:hypothetical protein
VPTRSSIRTALVALATLAVAGATLALGLVQPVRAAASEDCVAVIVDAHRLGGTVQTGCAQGDPSTGLQALTRAGFGYTPRPRDGLVCQIDTRPACTDTTSANYWSYWYRAPGSSHWIYANEGAGTHNPKPGSTEAWVWQAGGKSLPPNIGADTICPQLAAPRTATTSPTATSTKTKSPASTTSTASKSPRATPSRTPSKKKAPGTASPDVEASSSSSAADSSTAPPSTSATTAPPTDPAEGRAGDPPPDDSAGGALTGPAGAALGGAVVLGVGAAAVIRSRRGRP